MLRRSPVRAAEGLAVLAALALSAPFAAAQTESADWRPARLADGQPDIEGLWNNTRAMFTPLELPEDLSGRDDISAAELRRRAEARGTCTGPWTAAFPYDRDDDYVQFEYACHEGNYSVPNALGGARREEADAAAGR